MLLRVEHLASLVAVALGLSALLFFGAKWHGDENLALFGPAVILVAAGSWFVKSVRAYRYYNGIGLIKVNRRLAFALLGRARPGEVIRVGQRLYYRSRGRKRHTTPWPRLWVLQVEDLAAMRIDEAREVRATVYWPVPFPGGLRHRKSVEMRVRRTGRTTYCLHAYPLPRGEWTRLVELDYTQLLGLYRDVQRAFEHISGFHNSDRIGNSHRFEPRDE